MIKSFPRGLFVVAALVIFLAGCSERQVKPVILSNGETIPERPDYNWDVRPILSQNCFICHGNSKQKAGLRLDTAKAAYGRIPEDQAHKAIVPGNLDASELISRITSGDPDMRMPPKDTHKVLSEREIAILSRWVQQGAKYEQHWAYIRPKEIKPKASPWEARAANPIDRYIFARLAKEGLQPSPEADRETLINRVTLDLTGLPPTLADVDAFVADKRPDAYERLVDRLLGSRAYAERQANVWMDVARYADSDGFLFDNAGRFQHPYRDWVISAFQRNLPYDKFVTWQLAGDKLPNATREQILATAFTRMGKRSNEGGIIDEEYRVEYGLERTELMGKAFLGLTVGCAKCHDHKYDVISQRDFYSMYGFFNNVDERGMAQAAGYGTPMGPTLAWPTPRQNGALATAHQTTLAREADYRAVLQTARADARARDARASRDQRVSLLKTSAAADLQAYYPLDGVYKAPLDPLMLAPNGVPLIVAVGPPPPKTPGFGEVVDNARDARSQDPDLPRLAYMDIQRAQAAARAAALALRAAPAGPSSQRPGVASPPRPLRISLPRGPAVRPADASRSASAPPASPPVPKPMLPFGLAADKVVWTPSGLAGGKPAALSNVKLTQGPKGHAVVLDDSIGMAAYGVGFFDRTDPFTLDAWVKLRTGKPYGQVNLLYNRFQAAGREGPGYELQLQDNHLRFALVHSQPYNELAIVSKAELPKGKWIHVTATYDGASRSAGAALYVDGKPIAVDVEHDRLTRTSMPLWGRGPFDVSYGFSWGKSFTKEEFKGGAVDEIRVYTRALTPLEVAYGNDPAIAARADDKDVRAQLIEIAAAKDPRVVKAQAAMKAARDAEGRIEIGVYQMPVLADSLQPRKTYVLDHGLYNVPTTEVQPQALDRVFHWKSGFRRDRLGLTEWMFDKNNPLTARVYVNRLWQGHFGTGIVETVEDFGTQGANPTHPELLDWLAIEFQRSGWDIKHMHRLIVTSATYRQSSNFTDALIQKDPRNFLLARGPRYRLPAETIRDSALFASGLLLDRPGGDSVFPYQPEGVWASIGVPAIPYPSDVPADEMHRRSMYTFVRRNAAFPSLTVFDMPDRNVSSVARRISNTPLQALVLLNDTQYVEAYRKLAERAIKLTPVTDQQLLTVFRLATRRHPSAPEMASMQRYLAAETDRLAKSPDEADKLLKLGVALADPSIPKVQLAAMTMVTAGVMNTPDAYSLR